jgi:trigger factor
MNITKENTGELTAAIKINFEPQDYKEKVDKVLKDYQRKANIPGFRPGKVPFGVINKMYGKAVTFEEINNLLSESIQKYLEDNKLEILATPLPNHEKNSPIDLDIPSAHDFYFDIALQPEVNFKLDESIKIPFYRISADNTMVDKYITDMRDRHGKYIDIDVAGENDYIFAQLDELDADGNKLEKGISKMSSVFINKITDKETKKSLLGLTKESEIIVDPKKVAATQDELIHMLGIKEDDLEKLSTKFSLKALSIGNVSPADLNEEFFFKITNDPTIKTEEQLREKILEYFQKDYEKHADSKFLNDVIETLIDKTNVSFPDDFLKRYMLETAKDKEVTKEKIEADYPNFTKSLKWQLIENKIIKENDLQVTDEQVKEYVKGYFKPYFTKPHVHEEGEGHEHHDHSDETDETQLNKYVDSYLSKDTEDVKKIYDKLYDERLMGLMKQKLGMKYKDITYEDFIKLSSKNNS